jgi:predicted permease
MSANVILIFVCLALGSLLRRTGRFPEHAARTLNTFVIWVSVPAVVLLQVPRLVRTTPLGFGLLVPVSMAWLQFGLSLLVFGALGRARGWDRGKTGALILTAGLANTAFVGLPLLEALLGTRSLGIGLMVDQPGSFLCVSTVGVLCASFHAPRAERPSAAGILRGVATFPPFVALGLAIGSALASFDIPELASEILGRLGATLVPVALVAVGLQLRVSRVTLSHMWRPLVGGLLFKLVAMPLAFFGLYVVLLGEVDFTARVTILESAMAPMIMAAVVADEFDLDRQLANLMVGVGIPLSLVTVPLWNASPLLQRLGH